MAPTGLDPSSKPSRIPRPTNHYSISALQIPERTHDGPCFTNAKRRSHSFLKDYQSPPQVKKLANCHSISSKSSSNRSSNRQSEKRWSPLSSTVSSVGVTSGTFSTATTATTNSPPPTSSGLTSRSEPQWASVPTEEPLSCELIEEIRADLKKFYHIWRRDESFSREIRSSWVLPPFIMTLGSLKFEEKLYPGRLRRLYNKPTWFYYAHSGQINDRCTHYTFFAFTRSGSAHTTMNRILNLTTSSQI